MWVKVFKKYIYIHITLPCLPRRGEKLKHILGEEGGESLAMLWEVEGMLQIVPTQAFTHEKETIFFFPKIKGQI